MRNLKDIASKAAGTVVEGTVVGLMGGFVGTFAGIFASLLANDQQAYDKIAHFFNCCYALVDTCQNPDVVTCGDAEYLLIFKCLQNSLLKILPSYVSKR